MGVPNDKEFQSNVLTAALKLLDAPGGPIIEDYNVEAPASDGKLTTLACPVVLGGGEKQLSDIEKLIESFKEEITGLRQWYDMAVEKRGRTTVGASGMAPKEIGDFVSKLISGQTPENPRQNIAMGYSINLAIDDLRAYYSEAITAQPGQESPTSHVLNHWFWTETSASKAIYTLRDTCRASDDGFLKLVGTALLIPVEYAGR